MDNVKSLDVESDLESEASYSLEQTEPAGSLTYPKHLAVMIGEQTFVAEDYATLVATYGKFAAMLLRTSSAVTAVATTMAIVKVGILGRSMKRVPRADVIGYLTKEDADLFAGRKFILVCAPPLDAAMAMALSNLAISEAAFLENKLVAMESMDAIIGFTPERAEPLVQDIVRYLSSTTESHRSRMRDIDPPVGEWNIYTEGAGAPTQDKLTSAIKGFASHSTRVYPALPAYDDDEADALIRIHDLLVQHEMQTSANLIMTAALSSPLFAQLAHYPELFNPERNPPIEVTWAMFTPLVNHHYSEELTHAAHRDNSPDAVTGDTSFVFTLEEVIALKTPNTPPSVEHAFNRLNEYVGNYLRDLDLSKTLITGSALAAATIRTDVETNTYAGVNLWAKYLEDEQPTDPEQETAALAGSAFVSGVMRESCRSVTFDDWRAGRGYLQYIAAHYPATKTIPRDRDEYLSLVKLVDRNHNAVELSYTTTCVDDQMVLTLTATLVGHDHSVTEKTAVLDVLPGADVDMSIVVDSNDEFDTVARGHYEVIKKHHPSARLEKALRADPTDQRYNWTITTRDPRHIATFRPVEMYRASFNHVVTHHVGMVSAAFTALYSDKPQFIMSARHVLAAANLATPNYYYFASRKVAPQFVVMKYFARGFDITSFPVGIRTALSVNFRDDPLWSSNGYGMYEFNWPATNGKGYFSAYSLEAEFRARMP